MIVVYKGYIQNKNILEAHRERILIKIYKGW